MKKYIIFRSPFGPVKSESANVHFYKDIFTYLIRKPLRSPVFPELLFGGLTKNA